MIHITQLAVDRAGIAIQGERDGRRKIALVVESADVSEPDAHGHRSISLALDADSAAVFSNALRVEALDTKLQMWLRANNMTAAQLAERIGTSRSSISRIAAGQTTAKLKIAIAIQRFTDDAVMPADLAYDDDDADAIDADIARARLQEPLAAAD